MPKPCPFCGSDFMSGVYMRTMEKRNGEQKDVLDNLRKMPSEATPRK